MITQAKTKVLLASCGGWYLPHTAKGLAEQDSLAGLWISNRDRPAAPRELYRRCWTFHMAMKPLFLWAPQIWIERCFYAFFPIWRAWVQRQPWPECNVVHAIMGYATELFDQAERKGILKVVDCQNSHPSSYRGYWQRECDLWCPGEKVPIPDWMFARMTRELERADVVLCPSDFVKDTMSANGIPDDKCFINPFGVDTNIFKPRSGVPARPRFVSVGTICVRKGQQYLFRAFEQVKQAVPEAELVCVGDYKRDFRRERPKWEGTFTHHRSLDHAQLSELLKTCSAFVLASVEEGFARVISEAMGAGLPIIATYESGARTQVTDGLEGFIVPSREPEKLAAAMIRVAKDSELNRHMGEAACRKGALQNTWHDYANRLLVEYRRRLAV
jgi:glycosyltransferase involved in cell wall biosynthesis